jgi:undecaprenyl-diphosphatase
MLWSNVVKAAVDRPRPPVDLRITAVSGASFPSGHATQAAAVYGMVVLVLTAGRSVRLRVAAWSAVVVIVGAVGLSRVYLGAHWPTDVLGGYALGAMWITVLASALLLSRPRVPGDRFSRAREEHRGDATAPPAPPADGATRASGPSTR